MKNKVIAAPVVHTGMWRREFLLERVDRVMQMDLLLRGDTAVPK